MISIQRGIFEKGMYITMCSKKSRIIFMLSIAILMIVIVSALGITEQASALEKIYGGLVASGGLAWPAALSQEDCVGV